MENKKFVTHRIVSKSQQILIDARSKAIRAAGIELNVGDSIEITITKTSSQKEEDSVKTPQE